MILGYSVEIKHNDTETTFQDHGYVRILTSEGQELAAHDSVQHNRNFNKRLQILAQLAQVTDEKFKELA
jgi:hypothetical protein